MLPPCLADPIMNETFCAGVGRGDDGRVNCSRIDLDSLLLGGCYCHECLPEDPCLGGGVCLRYKRQGYSCDCSATNREGDHCQVGSDGKLDPSFVWYSLPAISTEEPPTNPVNSTSAQCVLTPAQLSSRCTCRSERDADAGPNIARLYCED